MSESSSNKLDILPAEKRKLRLNKIKISEIHYEPLDRLQSILNISKIRAMELHALSEFQSLPSVGIRFAEDLISQGFYSLKDLKGKNPAKLLDRYERQLGVWTDPCVEDQFRLVVYYASYPEAARNWWDFTAERKSFRQQHGYPSNRPTKAWYELDRFKSSYRIHAKGETTKKDLYNRIKLAVQFMKMHADDDVTLAQLANVSHLSRFHFLRLFKSVYDVTPLKFLTHLRLKKASLLLKKTKRMVSVIGPQCGFENESSFIRLFKKEFRVTPLVFRKSYLDGRRAQ